MDLFHISQKQKSSRWVKFYSGEHKQQHMSFLCSHLPKLQNKKKSMIVMKSLTVRGEKNIKFAVTLSETLTQS